MCQAIHLLKINICLSPFCSSLQMPLFVHFTYLFVYIVSLGIIKQKLTYLSQLCSALFMKSLKLTRSHHSQSTGICEILGDIGVSIEKKEGER